MMVLAMNSHRGFGAFINVAVILLLVMTGTISAARGRPIITNKTMVADNGELLRGVSCHSLDYVRECSWNNLSWWTKLRDDAKINCVRFMAYTDYWKGTIPSSEKTSIAIMQQRFDIAVKHAADAGLYLILDDHSTCCTGYETVQCSTFWTNMAPRYKDETHVIYELKNEPSDGGDQATINLNKKIHPIIRSRAPNTPIIILSEGGSPESNFVDMIKSFNASINIAADGKTVVGFHGYGVCSSSSYENIGYVNAAISAGFPVFMTESGKPGAKCEMIDFATYWQKQGIAWIFLWDNTHINCITGFNLRQTGFDYRNTPTWPRDPGTTSGGAVSTPTVSPSAGTFNDEVTVTLATVTSGAQIYYTTNGAAPTSSSTLYTSPIKLTNSATIKAVAIKSGLTTSSVTTATYTITSDGTAPKIVSTYAATSTQVTIQFDELVDKTTSEKLSNYSIKSGGIIVISGAVMEPSGLKVNLTTATLPVANVCTLTVNGVKDRASTPNTMVSVTTTFRLSSIPQDMIHYWKLDESSGTEASNEISEDHGSVVGPLWHPNDGAVKGALEFDGVDDYVPVGKCALPNAGSGMTISLWMKADDFGVFDARLISKANGAEESNHAFMISTFTNNAIRYRQRANNITTTLVSSPNAISTGVWHHLVAQYSGESMKIYVDTILVGSVTKTGSLNEPDIATACGIGNQPTDKTRAFDGLIDELYIYNRPLTISEIKALFNAKAGNGGVVGNKSYSNDLLQLQQLPTTFARSGSEFLLRNGGRPVIVDGFGRRVSPKVTAVGSGWSVDMKSLSRGIYYMYVKGQASTSVVKIPWM